MAHNEKIVVEGFESFKGFRMYLSLWWPRLNCQTGSWFTRLAFELQATTSALNPKSTECLLSGRNVNRNVNRIAVMWCPHDTKDNALAAFVEWNIHSKTLPFARLWTNFIVNIVNILPETKKVHTLNFKLRTAFPETLLAVHILLATMHICADIWVLPSG